MDIAVDFVFQTVIAILIARAMGPTKLGAWGYVLWISSMAVQVGNFGMAPALLKFLGDLLGQKRLSEVKGLIRSTSVFQGAVSLCIVGLGLLWVRHSLPVEQRTFASIAVLSIIPSGVLGIATAMNSATETQRNNAIPSVVGIVVQSALSIATLLWDWDLVGLATALLLGRVSDAVVRWSLALRWFPAHVRMIASETGATLSEAPVSRELRRELIRYCAHATLLLILRLVVWNRSEVFFIKQFCSLEQLAFYSVAAGFALLPTSLAMPFIQATVPSIFAERGRGSAGARRFTELSWRYLALIVFPSSFGLLILSYPLIHVLYGPQYHAAAPVLAIAMGLALIPPLINPVNSLVAAENGQYLLVRWNIVAALIVLALDWSLVRLWCATGAALANGLGQTIGTLGVCFIAARWFGLRLPYRFAGRLLAACSVMAGAVLAVVVGCPNIVAIIVGPPVGVAALVIGFRLVRVLEIEDVERFSELERVLPKKARRMLVWLLGWLGPRRVPAE